MIITKPSFYEYILNKLETSEDDSDIIEAIMSEMPMPAIRFKNRDTGEFEDKQHHVTSTIPIFTDWDDILYLYQFPPEFWPAANAYRYNQALYEVKKNPNYNDYQDIQFTIPGPHANKVVFKQRNTLAHNLLDKIERTVDINHFSKSDKHPNLKQQYSDQFLKNKETKTDMGGFIGADLSDPQRSTADPNLWASKAFIGPDPSSVKEFTTKWLDASSHGLLGDPDEGTHPGHKVLKLQGGKNAKRQIKALNTGKLLEIAERMKKVGAVPFTLHGNSPVWENVELTNKSGNSNITYPINGTVHLPILFPGKAIDSKSSKKYELQRHVQTNLDKIKLEDLEKFDSLNSQQQDAKLKLANNVFKNRKEKDDTVGLIKKLEPVVAFGKWIREQGIVPTNENLNDLKIEFFRKIHDNYRDIAKNAKTYDSYDWNVHRFNHSRHEHDPLETGMGNPLRMGDYKFPSLRQNSHGYGMFYPNRQSKSMIHGQEGDWEDHLQDLFGVGSGTDNKVKSHLNADEFKHVQKEVAKYAKKIGDKLASDKEVTDFLGIDDPNKLSSPKSIMGMIREKEKQLSPNGDLKLLLKNGMLQSDSALPDGMKIPEKLRKALPELLRVEKDLGALHADTENGVTKSDIRQGVEDAINRKFSNWPVLKAALEANKEWIVYNAENLIKRNSGETPFLHYLNAIKNPDIKPLEKHKLVLEAKLYIRKLSMEYVERIAQLDLESIGTRRLRNKINVMGSSGKTDDDGKEMSYDVSDSDAQNRLAMRGSYEDPETKEFINSYFGSMQKSQYRKNRSGSDATSYTIGHAASTVHSQITAYAQAMAEKVKATTDASAKKLAVKNGEAEATSTERQMLHNIGTSIALYDFFKSMYGDKKIGPPANADKWAKEKMMNVLKRNNLMSNGENDYEGISMALRHNPADAYERRAGVIMQSWENQMPDGTSHEEEKKIIDLKISDMISKINSYPNQEEQKKIIDRLCVMNHRKPEFGTFNIAAFKTDTSMPDVQLPRKVRDSLGIALSKLKNKYNVGQSPQQSVSASSPNISSIPNAVNTPNVSPNVSHNPNAIAGIQQMQSQPKNPLGGMLKKKPN